MLNTMTNDEGDNTNHRATTSSALFCLHSTAADACGSRCAVCHCFPSQLCQLSTAYEDTNPSTYNCPHIYFREATTALQQHHFFSWLSGFYVDPTVSDVLPVPWLNRHEYSDQMWSFWSQCLHISRWLSQVCQQLTDTNPSDLQVLQWVQQKVGVLLMPPLLQQQLKIPMLQFSGSKYGVSQDLTLTMIVHFSRDKSYRIRSFLFTIIQGCSNLSTTIDLLMRLPRCFQGRWWYWFESKAPITWFSFKWSLDAVLLCIQLSGTSQMFLLSLKHWYLNCHTEGA